MSASIKDVLRQADPTHQKPRGSFEERVTTVEESDVTPTKWGQYLKHGVPACSIETADGRAYRMPYAEMEVYDSQYHPEEGITLLYRRAGGRVKVHIIGSSLRLVWDMLCRTRAVIIRANPVREAHVAEPGQPIIEAVLVSVVI